MPGQTYSQPRNLNPFAVGVGLRSAHYSDALAQPYKHNLKPDFVEVHAENFFATGGINHNILEAAEQLYAVSIHGTGMGLGSYEGVSIQHLKKIKQLIEQYQPALVSDHAAFSLGKLGQDIIHAGDLLPIEFNQKTLNIFESNLHQAQDAIGRILLIENICSYRPAQQSDMSETEFLTELCHRTGCGLLIDLNNLVVNAVNQQEPDIQTYIGDWLTQIPSITVGEYHLAGCASVNPGDIMVDDHSTEITFNVWNAYTQALTIIGPRPTLIEWDTDLPSWDILLNEVTKTKALAQKVLGHE
jgi:uncharacterized protein